MADGRANVAPVVSGPLAGADGMAGRRPNEGAQTRTLHERPRQGTAETVRCAGSRPNRRVQLRSRSGGPRLFVVLERSQSAGRLRCSAPPPSGATECVSWPWVVAGTGFVPQELHRCQSVGGRVGRAAADRSSSAAGRPAGAAFLATGRHGHHGLCGRDCPSYVAISSQVRASAAPCSLCVCLRPDLHPSRCRPRFSSIG